MTAQSIKVGTFGHSVNIKDYERQADGMTKKLTKEQREALREEARKIVDWGRENNFPMQPKKKKEK